MSKRQMVDTKRQERRIKRYKSATAALMDDYLAYGDYIDALDDEEDFTYDYLKRRPFEDRLSASRECELRLCFWHRVENYFGMAVHHRFSAPGLNFDALIFVNEDEHCSGCGKFFCNGTIRMVLWELHRRLPPWASRRKEIKTEESVCLGCKKRLDLQIKKCHRHLTFLLWFLKRQKRVPQPVSIKLLSYII